MRVVIATTSGFHLRHLARELTVLGREVIYMTYLPYSRIRRDQIPMQNARSYFWRLQPWSTAALFRYAPELQHRAVEIMFKRTDEAIVRDLPRCDVFIGLSGMALESARAARQKYGAKVILERGSRHVSSQNEILSAASGRPLTATYIARELAGYEIADYIVLPSTHALDSFRERGFHPSRLFKNRYGVVLGDFPPATRPDGPIRLLFVGSWTIRKGCDVLTHVLRANSDLALTHVGMRGDLEFPALPNFTSVGHKTHRELPEVMARHHILVLPSREDGFGMVLVEALSSGLPIIGSSMTGAPDLRALIGNKDAVGLVEPGSGDSLIRAIRDMVAFVRRQSLDRKLLTDEDKLNLSWAAYARRYDVFLRAITST